MNTEQLKGVIAIDEEGSVSQAAKRLFISQSTLSNSIATLEQEVGFRIFERSSHGMRPTEKGHRLISDARSILLFSNDILSIAAANQKYVRFRLLSPREERINKTIVDFCDAHRDDTSIDISFAYASKSNAIEMIYRNLADYALFSISRADAVAITSLCKSHKIRMKKIGDITLEIICSDDHPLLHEKDLLAALSAYPHIQNPDLPERGFTYSVGERHSSSFEQEKLSIMIADRETRLAILSRGVGYMIGVLDEDAAKRWHLASRPIPDPLDIYAFVSEDKTNDPTILEFEQLLYKNSGFTEIAGTSSLAGSSRNSCSE